jgi:hypothetical protein
VQEQLRNVGEAAAILQRGYIGRHVGAGDWFVCLAASPRPERSYYDVFDQGAVVVVELRPPGAVAVMRTSYRPFGTAVVSQKTASRMCARRTRADRGART